MKNMRARAGLALVACTLLLTACNGDNDSNGDSRGEDDVRHALTLLHTNDIHSHLEPFDEDPVQGGVARLKAAVSGVRTEVGDGKILLVDAGDYFQGTLFFNAWQGSDGVMVLNDIGYDAVTLGNHEFDLGPAGLARALRGDTVTISGTGYTTERIQPPVVITNLDYSAEPELAGQDLLRDSVIVEKSGRRIGIVGMLTSTTANIASPGPNVRFLDYVESVQAEVDRLTADGVTEIVLLSHVGYGFDVDLAEQFTGVDIIVSGHDHRLLGDAEALAADPASAHLADRVAGPYPTERTGADGKPVLVVSSWEWGRVLGRLDVEFDDAGHLVSWSGGPIAITDAIAEDAGLAAKVAEYKQPVEDMSLEVIGEAGVLLDGDRNFVRYQEAPLGNLVADVLLNYGRSAFDADVALTNGGGIRASIAQGTVTFGDALSVLPFGNTIAAVEVTGAELVAALDNGLTWAYDPASNTTRSSGAFPQIAGMTVTFCGETVADIRAGTLPPTPCAGAIRDGGVVTGVSVGATPVALDANYRVVSNNFTAINGGDFYTMFAEACAREGGFCQDSGVVMLDELVREFRENSPVSRSVEGRLVSP